MNTLLSHALVLIFAFSLAMPVTAQIPPGIEWQRCLGGTGFDHTWDLRTTPDGGYITVGLTNSTNGDVSSNNGDHDIWVVKLDTSGEIEWEKTYGGSDYDNGQSIESTPDGGYFITGTSRSADGDLTMNQGGADIWVLKLDAAGSIQWQKSYGGSGNDLGSAGRTTSDGGYIIAGISNSTDGDVTGNHGYDDYWVIKLDASGNLEWQKSLGGSDIDWAFDVIQTYDGNYIIAGGSSSNDGDVSMDLGLSDYWVVKLDAGGVIEWERSYGGSLSEYAASVAQTFDGGFVVIGSSPSSDGQITSPMGEQDVWIVKLDQDGMLEWQRSYGGSQNDRAGKITQTGDGGYVFAGTTNSPDGDITEHNGEFDAWVVRLDAAGELIWQKTMGGPENDGTRSFRITGDGGFIIAANTNSNSGDVSGNHGDDDHWIVKLSADPVRIVENSMEIGMVVFPNPAIDHINVEFVLDVAALVQLRVHDAQGRSIFEYAPHKLEAGRHVHQLPLEKIASGLQLLYVVIDDVVVVRQIVKMDR